ncbi:ML domain-containing protein [Aspergillus cavernicola]|uniref:Phosphatidylglycerol/phosphatidylinositol transfer protein n=1 Tax=Aspergillus cavernicola TaxID=176166 RepID=A0ABR4J4J3_9EURO
MKLLSFAAPLLCLAPLSVTATPASFFGSSQDVITNGIPVKGENPLEYCSDPKGYILDIKSVDLSPNPPKPGQSLKITASGTLHKRIEKGAYVLLEVKYGLITLVRQRPDLCDQIVNVDLECPLEAGEMSLTKEVQLPAQIPPGKYTVHADVFTKDDERITCLDARNIQF